MIEEGMGFEPTPSVPEFREALVEVQGSAQTTSTNAATYIDRIDGCPVSCAGIETEAECESFVCCDRIWTDNPDPVHGYCDIDTEYALAG